MSSFLSSTLIEIIHENFDFTEISRNFPNKSFVAGSFIFSSSDKILFADFLSNFNWENDPMEDEFLARKFMVDDFVFSKGGNLLGINTTSEHGSFDWSLASEGTNCCKLILAYLKFKSMLGINDLFRDSDTKDICKIIQEAE